MIFLHGYHGVSTVYVKVKMSFFSVDRDLHCLCRTPDDGQFMIQCDYCDEWYHGACINLTPEQADMWVKFRCPRCQDPESTGTF